MDFENVLAKAPGEYVSVALHTLPSAATDTVDKRTMEYDVPQLGRVRFYFKRLSAKKGKSPHAFWNAQRAVVIGT